ncbi:MAG: carboxypeptidase regulatory-like domain-containing protein [Bacteroidales bacterium]|jgi:hypothetical protein|nr:carboxypeptidase regulatory-like domain-containing protein [Bacteroidales bacterium]
MKKNILLLFIFISSLSVCQNNNVFQFVDEKLNTRGEIYFSFENDDRSVLNELSGIISIDKINGSTVYAFANRTEFNEFLAYGINFTPVYSYYNTFRSGIMATTLAEMANWDKYPTHAVYQEMMQNFVTNYPNLCSLDTIGFSVNNRPILCLIISDNIGVAEDEPKFFWSSSMHGNELCGYILTLRYADYLLSNYGIDDYVTSLINNIEIYICPLANPDGMYNNSSDGTSVSQAIRYNANEIDLNRNFPRVDGQSTSIQPEIQCMVDYANSHDFVMGANLHTGAELMNYPWDYATSATNSHADSNWWNYVSWKYANLAQQNSPAGYFTDESGVTEGGDWYVITGSRQDYMNYFKHYREVTIEICSTHNLDPSLLNNYWNYNRQAMLEYTEQVLFGFRGIVKDECTGNPLPGVKIEINGYDKDGSEVYSSAPVGNYHRLIYEGTYNVTFSKEGYESKTISITTTNNDSTRLNIELTPVLIADFSAEQTYSCSGIIQFNSNSPNATGFLWNFGDGTTSTESDPIHYYTTSGIYSVELFITNGCDENNYSEDNFIEIELPDAPVVTGVNGCGQSFLSLYAEGNGDINWYESLNQEIPFHTGESFDGDFSVTTTYFVQSEITNINTYNAGANSNTIGNGGYYSGSAIHGMYFDVYEDIKLESVKVTSNREMNRTFTLKNSNNVTIAEKTVNIPVSTSFEVELNFDIPRGTGYKLILNTPSPYLYRNSTGGNYPYTIDNVLSITHNTITDSDWSDYYYFFYDWTVKTEESCLSPRVPITATIFPEIILDYFVTNETTEGSGSITLDISGGVPPYTVNWEHGPNETILTGLNAGFYSVTVTDQNVCFDTKTIEVPFYSGLAGFSPENISVFPNPSTGNFTIKSTGIIEEVSITNNLGEICYYKRLMDNTTTVNPNLEPGIYIVCIKTENKIFREKITVVY